MTRPNNARLAGFTFLAYIAAGLSDLAGVGGALTKPLLGFIECFAALTLAVTLYAITRDEDADIAMLAMMCRVGEAVLGGVSLRGIPGSMLVGATFFAVGSLLFSWLLLRGRMIPVALAWVGVIASMLLVIVLPLRLGGAIAGTVANVAWLPMLAFEVPLGFWLILNVPRSAASRATLRG